MPVDVMDAGPSHASLQHPSSGSETYSDADSEYTSEEYDGDRELNDGASVKSKPATSDFSDEYEDKPYVGKGKGKGTARVNARHAKEHTRPQVKVQKTEKARSWSDLDVSMIIALLSPVGNWLTGSDHVKNLFLLLLLVFYLHQLIEVPWQLYSSSRARITLRTAFKLDEAGDSTSQVAKLALSELQFLELLYLSCTVIAPFIGAGLIRYVFSAMNGVDSLSWFSTALFVLATGIRPWSHLVSRLQERTGELQDAVGEPERKEKERENGHILREVLDRLEVLERAVSELKARTAKVAPLQEACDDLSEAIGDMERSVLRHERKVEAARIAQGSRISAVERTVYKIEESQKSHHAIHSPAQTDTSAAGVYLPIHPRVAKTIHWAAELPQKLHNTALMYLAFSIPQRAIQQSPSQLDPVSPAVAPSHTQTNTLHIFNGTPLETIPEAEDSDSDNTYVCDKTTSPVLQSPELDKEKRNVRFKSRSRSRSHTGSRPPLHRQKSYSRMAFDWAAAVVSWPYRCAINILVFVVPSHIRKLFV